MKYSPKWHEFLRFVCRFRESEASEEDGNSGNSTSGLSSDFRSWNLSTHQFSRMEANLRTGQVKGMAPKVRVWSVNGWRTCKCPKLAPRITGCKKIFMYMFSTPLKWCMYQWPPHEQFLSHLCNNNVLHPYPYNMNIYYISTQTIQKTNKVTFWAYLLTANPSDSCWSNYPASHQIDKFICDKNWSQRHQIYNMTTHTYIPALVDTNGDQLIQ
jgi:hypothetical protein